MKHLLSGNEAIARGAYEAGVRVCSAYPGTPSTEIFEQLPQYQDEPHPAPRSLNSCRSIRMNCTVSGRRTKRSRQKWRTGRPLPA